MIDEKTLLKLLPEIQWITDEDLRRKVVDVFLEAIEEGGWDETSVAEIPFSLLCADCGVSFIDHTRGVTRLALKIAEELKELYEDFSYNRDYLIAGALLHDVGKFVEIEFAEGEWRKSEKGKLLRHPFYGAKLAAKHGIPDEIVHAILFHSHEGDGNRRTPEAIIINHADFLNFEIFRR